jgi:hypothetical protein
MSDTAETQDGKYDVLTSMALLTRQLQTRIRGGHLAPKRRMKSTEECKARPEIMLREPERL